MISEAEEPEDEALQAAARRMLAGSTSFVGGWIRHTRSDVGSVTQIPPAPAASFHQ
jgi:hypothetical protein